MQQIQKPRLTEILPESLLADEKIRALAQALDFHLEKLSADVDKVLHLPRLNKLTGKILDLLAWQWHVDAFEPLGLSDETKRRLIRESVAWHRIKGTRAAIEQVNAAFGVNVKIVEWFEEGGEPYTFKIYTDDFDDETEYNDWYRRVLDAKNVRSHCGDVLIEKNEQWQIYAGLATFAYGKIGIPPSPPDVYVGFGHFISGSSRIKAAPSVYVGFGHFISGKVVVKSAT